MSFDFSKWKKEQEEEFEQKEKERLEKEREAQEAKQKVQPKPQPKPRPKRQPKVSEEPRIVVEEVEVPVPVIRALRDELKVIDIEIAALMLEFMKDRGTKVIRHNQKNPFLSHLLRLGYLLQMPEVWKELAKKGLLEKTAYAGQWKIV